MHRIEGELPVWHIAEPGRRIALIAHAGTNTIVICHLLGLPPTPWEWERMVLRHASISRLEAIPVGDGYTFSLTAPLRRRAPRRRRPHPVATRSRAAAIAPRRSTDLLSRGVRTAVSPGRSGGDVLSRPMATLDPDALKMYQFLVFTKLEGAVTSGMIHLGDKLGLYRALAAADGAADDDRAGRGHRARRAVGARVGLQPGRREARHRHDRRRRRALLGDAGGGGRAGVAGPRGVRHGHVPPAAADDAGAGGPAGELPHRCRRRLRQPRTAGGGRHRAQLRAVEPRPPAARRRAGDGRHRGQAARRCQGRRRRLRRRGRGAAARRGVPA